MVKRATAICDGQVIKIDCLYQVNDGKQINKPDILSWLRQKSRNKELFCSCGCGANLELVAGPSGKVAQHFRLDSKDQNRHCIIEELGEDAAYSHFVIKKWIARNNSQNISYKYIHEQANLKADAVIKSEKSSNELKTFYFVGRGNECNGGQYPEGLYSIQKEQGFILFLYPNDEENSDVRIKTVVYEKNLKETWEQLPVVENMLDNYTIDSQGDISYEGEKLITLSRRILDKYIDEREEKRENFEKTAFYSPIKRKHFELPENIEEIRKNQRIEQEKNELERKRRRGLH